MQIRNNNWLDDVGETQKPYTHTLSDDGVACIGEVCMQNINIKWSGNKDNNEMTSNE